MLVDDVYKNAFIDELEKISEYAPGLPDRSRKDPINQKGTTRIVIQRHKATNDHYDMRLQDGDVAHSWVVRNLPGEKDKNLAIQQPTHTADYMDFEGTIKDGYGAGTVEKVYDNKAIVTEANDKKIHMVIPEGEFTMIRTKYSPDSWLMIKHKGAKRPVDGKPKYKTIESPDLENEEKILEPKIDGAHSIIHLKSNGLNRIFSHRDSVKTNKPIEYTHKLPDIRDAAVPKELNNTVLRAEVYASKDGKPTSSSQVGGMLNASILNSLEMQKKQGKLKPYIFDIIKNNGEDVSHETYKNKLDLIKKISKFISGIKAPEVAKTKEEKLRLISQISQGKHKDTKEGLIEWDLNKPSGDPKKLKLRDTHDVVIRDIYQARETNTGKPKNEAGGFKYSWTPKGRMVGNVGTGFSKDMREDMWENPNNYIGQIARTKTQEIFSSGAMRSPSFYSLDVEKNLI